MMGLGLREGLNSALFTTHDSEQTTRLRRFSLSLYLHVVGLVIGLAAMFMGVINLSWREFWLIAGVAAASLSVIYLAIRSGFSRKFSDPSLTLAQMLIGIALLTYVLSIVQGVRGGLLNGYVLIVFFGLFRLDRKEYTFASAFAILGYSLVILLDLFSPPPNFDIKIELFQLSVLSVVMLSCAYIGADLQGMRSGLK